MVQYIPTAWRDRRELLAVRRQFYCTAETCSGRGGGSPAPQSQPRLYAAETRSDQDNAARSEAAPPQQQRRQQQQQAVARVSMWMQRGNCPHLVESTALLTAATLADGRDGPRPNRDPREAGGGGEEEEEGAVARPPTTSASSVNYASQAAYAAAFSRFVTGLLDSHQAGQHKLSMYAIAKNIGLPATFVELRHQSTHEQLPSLARLRLAASRALDWIWGYYWARLGDDEPAGGGQEEECRRATIAALSSQARAESGLVGRPWGQGLVLRILEGILEDYAAAAEAGEIGGGAIEPAVALRALRLEKEILLGRREEMVVGARLADPAWVRGDLARVRAELLEEGGGSAQCPGEEGMVGEGEGGGRGEEGGEGEGDGRGRGEKGGEAEAGCQPEGGSDQELGWSLWGTEWEPRPIGVV